MTDEAGIHDELAELSTKHPVYHSLDAFVDALAFKLQDEFGAVQKGVRLDGKKVHIYIPEEKICFMLSYRRSRFRGESLGEEFVLKEQGAWDGARVGILSSAAHLEALASQGMTGYAIILTNDDHYWSESRRGSFNTVDEESRIHYGRTVKGVLMGRKDGKSVEVQLRGEYLLRWHAYSETRGFGDCKFRYLLVKANPSFA